MSEKPQPKLSPGQVTVIEKMKSYAAHEWWNIEGLPATLEDLNALVEKGILLYQPDFGHDGWWRLKQRALFPEQKRAVKTMQNKAAQECWKPDDLGCDEVYLQILEDEGIIEKVYRLTNSDLYLLVNN